MTNPPAMISELEMTAQSRAFGSDDWGVDELRDAGYMQTEVLLSGEAAGQPYGVRALLRHPIDSAAFSGVVVMEPMHFAGARSVWPVVRREVVRSGHAWVEIACQPSAEGILKGFDPERYSSISIVDAAAADAPPEASIGKDAAAGRTFSEVREESEAFRRRWFEGSVQLPEIVAQFTRALREDRTVLKNVTTIIMGGLSQTGGVVRNFVSAHHTQLSHDEPVVDGYLAMCSGGDALPDIDVPVIELLAESEMEELRIAHLLPGQARGFTHRRPDSPSFRLYEVAGMSHSDSRDRPVRAPELEVSGEARWSLFPSTHVVGLMLRSLVRWIREDTEPAPGRVFDLDADETLMRDQHGHVLGGFRTAHLDVPATQVTVISSPGASWSNGYEVPFPRAELEQLYGDEAAWRERLERRLGELVASGYCLQEDAQAYLADASW